MVSPCLLQCLVPPNRFTGVGTRRPLLIQMTRDPNQAVPLIYFIDNEGKQDSFSTSPHDCAQRIADLSDEHLRKISSTNGFSQVAIVMKVYYKHCSNISVIDTPGLRPNDDMCNSEIEKIITYYLHRDAIPVYIQASGQEWFGSLITQPNSFIRKWDADLSHTIVCITKFEEKLSSLAHDKDGLKNFMLAKDKTMQALKPLLGFNYVSIGQPRGTILEDIESASIENISKMLHAGFAPQYVFVIKKPRLKK